MGSKRCCCGCSELFANFDWVGETEPDGVNPLGYSWFKSFDPMLWSVGATSSGWTSTGGSLQTTGGGVIHFLLGKPAAVEVLARLEDGMSAKLSSGGHYVEITATQVDFGGGDLRMRFAYDFDGEVYTEADADLVFGTGTVREAALTLEFVKPSAGTEELLYLHYPPFTQGMLRGPQCRDKPIDLAAESFDWTLEGSSGVEFDELSAKRLRAECSEYVTTCMHTCQDENPETIEIAIAGMRDTMGDCENGDRTECLDESAAAAGECNATAVGCEETCECATAKKARDCACNNDHTMPVRSCPKIADDVYTLTRLGDPKAKCEGPCYYRGVIPLEPVWDGVAEEDPENACQNNIEVETEILAELVTVGYNAGTKERIIRVDVTPPLTKVDDTPVGWSTGNIDAGAFCDGDALELTPTETLYADECKLGLRAASEDEGAPLVLGCQHSPGPAGPSCGDDTECPDEEEFVPCGDTPEINPELERPEHDEITLDDLQAV